MVRELLEETRHASMDEAGRKRLVEVCTAPSSWADPSAPT